MQWPQQISTPAKAGTKQKRAIALDGSWFALLSCVLQVRRLIIRPHYYHLAAFLLKLSHVTIAKLGAPLVSCRITTFHVIKWPMGMQAIHVLAEFMNVTFYDHARLRAC